MRSRVIATIAALAAAITVTIVITDVGPGPGPNPTPPRRTVTITLGGVGHAKVALDPKAQAIVAAQKADDASGDTAGAESDLHETRPPAPGAVAAARSVQPPGQPSIPARVPLAAASEPGCTSRFVRNSSSRRGAPIDLGVIHWTGSTDTGASTAGGLAIVRWFDTPAAQASSNYITDQAGRCWYVVPETQKAWTQAAANPWAVSVEIVNPGVLPLFRSPAGRERVVKLIIGWHHRWGIPYRVGRVNSSCVPTRSGFLAHRDLGACGGGHPDVGIPSAVPSLIASARAQDHPARVSTSDKTTCRKLNWWRTRRPHGRPERNAIARRRALAHHRVTCTSRGAVRR